jgi:hypothetical protein
MGFQADPVLLRAHAAQLDGLRDRLDEAVRAARQVSMSPRAYGLMNMGGIAPMVGYIGYRGIEALSEAVTSMQDAAAAIRRTAQVYDEVEQANERAMR